jgi:hypothetical protein
MKREATPDMRRIVLKGYRPSEDGGKGKTVIEDIIDVPMSTTPAGNLTAAAQRRIINAVWQVGQGTVCSAEIQFIPADPGTIDITTGDALEEARSRMRDWFVGLEANPEVALSRLASMTTFSEFAESDWCEDDIFVLRIHSTVLDEMQYQFNIIP